MYRITNQRAVLLIDADNIDSPAHNDYGTAVDYKKILQTVRQENLIRAMIFRPLGQSDRYQGQRLDELGYELKTTPKNVDCWLTISAVTLADKADVVILMGGDVDFLPLVWFLNSRGAKVIIWSWPQSTSAELKAMAEEYWPMTEEFLVKKQNNVIPLTANRR